MDSKNLFIPGRHRPVYLWAGAGTVRMNRLKFMDAPVDEAVHLEAHTPTGAQRMAEEAGFNWAYLTYDWGFPPEIEKEDWQAFRQAAEVYHASGMRVFGYIQTSNYVWTGSYRAKDWYARDPRGRPFYYYTGRYMSCWLNPEWTEHLREMVRGVIEAGADGVFFDNPWHASQPFLLGGAWLGSAGCFCNRCRVAFREETGLEIPAHLSPGKSETDRYLRWRASQVTHTLTGLAVYARALKPEVLISANDFDAVMRPSFVMCGIDLPGLAKVQDVLMIEDYGLPRWEVAKRTAPLLVNNVLTLHTALPLAGGSPVSTDPYDKGIGFDDVYPPRRFQQGMAEAAACGAPMVVKGTEYIANGQFTLLTAESYAPQRQAIGCYHRWLAGHAALFEDRENAAAIGVLYPGQALWQDWSRLAPRYFGVGQTLLAAHLPWRVVTGSEQMEGLQILLTFGPDASPIPSGLKTVDVLNLPGWELPRPSFLARQAWLQRLISPLVVEIYRAYFRFRWARRLLDRLGLVHFFLQSQYFILPPERMQQTLLATVGEVAAPRLQTEGPVLVEHWRQSRQEQLHLVNYTDQPQRVTVTFERTVSGQALSPDGPPAVFEGAQLNLKLDVYTLLLYSYL